MGKELVFYPVSSVQEFCLELLGKLGVPKVRAAIITKSLLCGDLRGIQSHGVVRLPSYIERIKKGVMSATAPIEMVSSHQAVALLTANNTFGQVAGYEAMKLAISKAGKYGASVVAVKNSNHFGVTAFYSMMALKKDMVGLVFTNASPAMAPYGAKVPLLGTNPLSISIPAERQLPIVLDMSTSIVARGKIRYAALTGKSIPLGWAMNQEGHPTQDPLAALGGSLEPIGGVKGAALSLIIDILCGVLTSTALTGEVKTLTDASGPSNTAHLFAALDISRFNQAALFKANVDLVIERIKSLPSVDGGPVYMPGEMEYHLAEQRCREGIPLDKEVLDALNSAARYHRVPELRR